MENFPGSAYHHKHLDTHLYLSKSVVHVLLSRFYADLNTDKIWICRYNLDKCYLNLSIFFPDKMWIKEQGRASKVSRFGKILAILSNSFKSELAVSSVFLIHIARCTTCWGPMPAGFFVPGTFWKKERLFITLC